VSIPAKFDYSPRPWYDRPVEEIAISKFKATCLAVLERVRRTGKPVLVTRFGQPVAEVIPPPVPRPPVRWLGALAGTAEIRGDIVAPATDDSDWEALSS
jgi:prevent-host-death family protein